ncbi:hypothetical protein [Methylophaga nitratireducenticrescens]|uniref:hypothetical protein n=1 Tax=Methylophaga nitratireducenticrescens TaxID=754476 RepID=UPI000CDBDDF6|nr:hypothetical protein [Methylophaga nitratireducenticrescens]AUZ85867.1 hypothetical protein CDW43_15405 [Methylophaga nitratireducenticrescens]
MVDDFIKDMRIILKKHDVFIDVNDEYDGAGNYSGKTVEIKSRKLVGGRLNISIHDMEAFAKQVND